MHACTASDRKAWWQWMESSSDHPFERKGNIWCTQVFLIPSVSNHLFMLLSLWVCFSSSEHHTSVLHPCSSADTGKLLRVAASQLQSDILLEHVPQNRLPALHTSWKRERRLSRAECLCSLKIHMLMPLASRR